MSFVLEQTKSLDELKVHFDNFVKNEHEKIIEMEKVYYDLMKKYQESQEKVKNTLEKNLQKIKKFKKLLINYQKNPLNEKDSLTIAEISQNINKISSIYENYTLGLPKKPTWFLSKCIGDIDISLYWKKYDYKESYENLKLNASFLLLFLLTIKIIIFPYRMFDTIYVSFILWYFSSLTLQEHILVANGSRIMLWWRLHHYISILGAGIVMVWPMSRSYLSYRPYFHFYSFLQLFVHIFQYTYQKRILYRLRALGATSSMVLTVDGFRAFMWNGFTFLIFILVLLYIVQLYHAIILFNIYRSPLNNEYYPLLLSIIFLTVFTGNIISVTSIIYKKAIQFVSKVRKSTDQNFDED